MRCIASIKWMIMALLVLCTASAWPSQGYLQSFQIQSTNLVPFERHSYSFINKLRKAPKLYSSLDKVISLTAESLGVDRSVIQPTSHFVNDLHADSLQTLELVMTLEDNFGIKIEDAQAAAILNAQEAANYIDAALAKKEKGESPEKEKVEETVETQQKSGPAA